MSARWSGKRGGNRAGIRDEIGKLWKNKVGLEKMGTGRGNKLNSSLEQVKMSFFNLPGDPEFKIQEKGPLSHSGSGLWTSSGNRTPSKHPSWKPGKKKTFNGHNRLILKNNYFKEISPCAWTTLPLKVSITSETEPKLDSDYTSGIWPLDDAIKYDKDPGNGILGG